MIGLECGYSAEPNLHRHSRWPIKRVHGSLPESGKRRTLWRMRARPNGKLLP